jgi:dipeptide/tripeptide permease
MAFGHPKGLFPLFFTEMWERLAFYTMVGILLLYTTDTERGGLGLRSEVGNEIYGLYLAFVYFTPFLGGMIADRFLGYRRAVALGGIVMGSGLLLMGLPGFTFFVLWLVGLIIGNGFFKPNISVMVGNLYEPGDPKRDTGFNIFYMGINIGAASATIILAPMMRNYFGWRWAFIAAGVGVFIAVLILAIFWKRLAKADRQPERSPDDTSIGEIFLKILAPAFVVGIIGYALASYYDFALIRPAVCGFLAGMIPVLIFFVRLGLTASEEERPGLLALIPIFVAGGAFFMILHLNGSAMTQWARDETAREVGAWPSRALTSTLPWTKQEGLPLYYINAAEEVARPHPDSLLVVDSERVARMYGQQRLDDSAVEQIASMPGIEVVDAAREDVPDSWKARASSVYADGVVSVRESTGAHGEPIVAVSVPDGARPERKVTFVRENGSDDIPVFVVDRETFSSIYDGYRERFGSDPDYLAPGEFLPVISPETYQTWNPIFVILLTPVVVFFFQWRVNMNKAVPTAHKLLYGMLLTTGALLIMALAGIATDGGMFKVSWLWLAGFYMVVTLGELCLSPMGLSLVTKLSPARLVGLTMGGWFLATAFGNNLSGFFGGIQNKMDPMYFLLLLSGLSALVALFLLAVLPRLDRAIRKYGA